MLHIEAFHLKQSRQGYFRRDQILQDNRLVPAWYYQLYSSHKEQVSWMWLDQESNTGILGWCSRGIREIPLICSSDDYTVKVWNLKQYYCLMSSKSETMARMVLSIYGVQISLFIPLWVGSIYISAIHPWQTPMVSSYVFIIVMSVVLTTGWVCIMAAYRILSH